MNKLNLTEKEAYELLIMTEYQVAFLHMESFVKAYYKVAIEDLSYENLRKACHFLFHLKNQIRIVYLNISPIVINYHTGKFASSNESFEQKLFKTEREIQNSIRMIVGYSGLLINLLSAVESNDEDEIDNILNFEEFFLYANSY